MPSNVNVNPDPVPVSSVVEPYVGPRPFKRTDKGIFFGRNRETLELTGLIKAHPDVLIYAQSGAGKTSLIDAQLIPTLEIEEEFDVLPPARVRSRRHHAIADEEIRNIYVFNALGYLSEGKLTLMERAQLTLAKYLAQLPRPPIGPPEDADKHSEPPSPTQIRDQKELRLARAVIFDQFEEMFTLYPDRYKDRQDFFRQVVEALAADPFLRVVFSMREDYIAELDPYIDVLPQKLSTRFRLERLRKANALAAVTEPLSAQGVSSDRTFAKNAAESLVDSLLLIKARTATGEKKEVPGEFVDPVQLQVVCQTLWEKLPPGVNTITEDHLKAYANVDEALLSYYESSIRKAIEAANVASADAAAGDEHAGPAAPITEESVRSWFRLFLITREGKRNMVFQGEKKTGTLQNRVVTELENQHLIRAEMRGDDKWYELSHDRLIAPIIESNQRRIRQQPLAIQKGEELESRTLDWINSGQDEQQLLNRAEVMDAKNWRQSPEAKVIGWTTELDLLIRQSQSAIEAEDNEQLRLLAQEQQARANAEAENNKQLRLLAQEQQARANAEAENNKQLRLLAQEQRARANAEHQRARQFKFGLVFASLLLLTALATTVLAVKATNKANAEAGRAHKAFLDMETAQTKAFEEQKKAEAAADIATDKTKRTQEALAATKIAKANETAAKEEAKKAEAAAKIEAKKAQAAEKLAHSEATRAREAEAREIGQRESAEGKAEALAKENKNYQSLSVSNHIKELLPTDPELSLSLALAATAAWPKFSHMRYGLRSAFVTWPEKHVVLGDPGTSVERAIFTHDGQIIRTVQIAGTTGTIVKVWDIAHRQETFNELGHDRGTAAITVSNDSTKLATEGADGTGRIWYLKEGVHKVLEGLTGPSAAIAFNGNGKLLATEGTVDDEKAGWAILIWDAEDRQHLTNATPLLRLVGHQGAVTAIDFSPTEDYLATASEDKTVRIWDVKTGTLKNTLTGHTERVNSVSFDRAGNRIVTAGNDGTARVWDKLTGKELITLSGHLGNVTKALFSSDGQQILTIAESKSPDLVEDNLVRVWNAGTGALRLNVGGHTKQITDASFSNNGRMIVTASKDGTAQLWDAATGANLMAFKGHAGPVSKAEFSPDDKFVLTSGTDNTAQVWRIPPDALEPQFFFARKTIPELGSDDGPIEIDFHSDQRIVTVGTDGWVRSWDPQTLKENTQEAMELPLPDGVPSSRADYLADIKRSPDGRYIASALRVVSTDPASIKAASIARVWDTVKRRYIELIPESGAPVDKDSEVSKLAYSPKGKYLLTASKNGAAVLWDTATWKGRPVVAELLPAEGRSKESPGAILAAAFDDTEQWLVTGHETGAIEVFRTANGKNVFVRATAHGGPVLSIAFSRDNKLIITGSADGTAAVWEFDKEPLASDLQENKREAVRIVTPIPHTRPVTDARFSYDGNFIVTACADNTVRVWENPTGVLVAEFKTQDTPWSADLSPDNKHLAVGGFGGFGEVFACEACRPFDVLKAEAIQRKPRKLTKVESNRLELEGEKIKGTEKDN